MRRRPFRTAATLLLGLAAGCSEAPKEAPPPPAADAQAGPYDPQGRQDGQTWGSPLLLAK